MARYPGRDLNSLRDLAVALARSVVFGDDTMARSSKSGRYGTYQLDPEKLAYIKSVVRGRVGTRRSDTEFELMWKKCLESIGKQCQKLRAKRRQNLF